MRAFAAAVFLLATMSTAPCSAQLAQEDADADGVLDPVDFSFRYYIDHMNRFPDRVGIICVNAYWLDKTGDHEAALAFFNECAKRGNPPSMIYLSNMYELGHGVPVDLSKSTGWLKRAAETGYAVGQYHYGMALLQGKGVGRDVNAGKAWLRKAAAQGDDDARAALANLEVAAR